MNTFHKALRWLPTLLGVGLSLFLGMFALDAVGEGFVALAMHLVPAATVLGVTILSLRWPGIAGAVLIGLGTWYAAATMHRPDWILAIAGPLFFVGGLFLLRWRLPARSPVTTTPA